MGWFKKIFGSKEEKVVIKELSEEEKDLEKMEAELLKLKKRKFRVERVEYDHTTENVKVVYYAQIHGKMKHSDFYTKEYNENEWWRLSTGRGGNVYVEHFTGGGAGRWDEKSATELIELYKKQEEEEIRRTPERNKWMRDYKKIDDERKKEIKAEYERTKPKSTFKEI